MQDILISIPHHLQKVRPHLLYISPELFLIFYGNQSWQHQSWQLQIQYTCFFNETTYPMDPWPLSQKVLNPLNHTPNTS